MKKRHEKGIHCGYKIGDSIIIHEGDADSDKWYLIFMEKPPIGIIPKRFWLEHLGGVKYF